MTHSLFILILLLARVAVSSGAPPVFAFEADSLKTTVTRLGGASAEDFSGGPGWSAACDSAGASAQAAWFMVEVIDKRAGTSVRFPADASALRQGLGPACREGADFPPARVAAGLRALASRLRVRMRAPDAEPAE